MRARARCFDTLWGGPGGVGRQGGEVMLEIELEEANLSMSAATSLQTMHGTVCFVGLCS